MKTDNLCESVKIALKTLGLQSMLKTFESTIERAEAQNWGYARFLHHLAEQEAAQRLTRKVERLIKDADLPHGLSLVQLEQEKLPEKARRQLPSLLAGDFVRRGDNLLCFGLPGRGKSHYVAALGRELIHRHQMKLLFSPTFKLVSHLLVAKSELKLPAYLDRLDRYEAIVLDDLGYVQHTAEEMEVLFTFFAHRYERQRSLLITSNLVFSQWDQIFKNSMTAMAAVDRLVHRGIILEFNGESFRAQAAKARQAA